MLNPPLSATASEIYTGEVSSPGNWVFAWVGIGVNWPANVSKVRYDQDDIFVITCGRVEEGHEFFYPSVAV